MSTTIRIDEDHKDLIDDIAEQLDTSRKEVLEGILNWFFSDAGGVGSFNEEFGEDEDEDEDADADEDDEEE